MTHRARRGSALVLTLTGLVLLLLGGAAFAYVFFIEPKPRDSGDDLTELLPKSERSIDGSSARAPTAPGARSTGYGAPNAPRTSPSDASGSDSVDSDGDGTPDSKDGCPRNKTLTAERVWYRDIDEDRAGDPNTTINSCEEFEPGWVLQLGGPDGKGDACPGDPAKVLPGDCGCGVAEVDANRNGVSDCLEPGPAAPPGAEESDVESDARALERFRRLAELREEMLRQVRDYAKVPNIDRNIDELRQVLGAAYDLHVEFSAEYAADLARTGPGLKVQGGGFIVTFRRDVASDGLASRSPRRCDPALLPEWIAFLDALVELRRLVEDSVEAHIAGLRNTSASQKRAREREIWSGFNERIVPNRSGASLRLADFFTTGKINAERSRVQELIRQGKRP